MLFNLLQSSPGVAVAFILALAIGISVHEFSHALAGYLQGDMTAKDQGRLTLNPMAHFDPLGTMMLLLVGFGWGKPTPYNPNNLRYHRWGPALVAIAGPVSNLIVAVVSVMFLRLLHTRLPEENLLIIFLSALFLVNSMLMIFNLIPIPPLDGSQLVFTILPERFNRFKHFLATNGPWLLFGLILLDSFSQVGIFSSLYGFFLNLAGRFIG